MTTQAYQFPHPVADTLAGPKITWDDYTLLVEFTSYAGTSCKLRFIDTLHFELVSEDELDSSIYLYDGVTQVLDSPIIHRLIEVGEIQPSDQDKFHHIVIGFNEIGSYLSVVSKPLENCLG